MAKKSFKNAPALTYEDNPAFRFVSQEPLAPVNETYEEEISVIEKNDISLKDFDVKEEKESTPDIVPKTPRKTEKTEKTIENTKKEKSPSKTQYLRYTERKKHRMDLIVPESVYEKVKEQAKKNGISVNEYAIQCFLKNVGEDVK